MHKSIILFLKPYKYLVISGFAVVSITALLIITPRPCYNDGFRNLSELQEYAKTIDEFIKMENDNYNLPTYESYYQKNFGPSVWKTIQEKLTWLLCSIGLKKKPPFSPCFLKTILKKVSAFRQSQKWDNLIVQKTIINKSSKIIAFGALQGAFHSLVRNLTKLKNLQIIDEKLKLQSPYFYVVFLGNVVDRSPYTLETFSVVLRLLEQNPFNVIYLKGTHESSPQVWKQHTLGRELELKAYTVSTTQIPLEKEVSTFFESLPIAFYCTSTQNFNEPIEYFKLSGFIEDKNIQDLMKEENINAFLAQQNKQQLETFALKSQNDKPTQRNVILKAIITDIKKRDSYEEMNGLRLLSPIDGVAAWTVLSCPTEPYRHTMNFFYDAFTLISAANISDWNITIFNRDIRIKENDYSTRSFSLFNGKAI